MWGRLKGARTRPRNGGGGKVIGRRCRLRQSESQSQSKIWQIYRPFGNSYAEMLPISWLHNEREVWRDVLESAESTVQARIEFKAPDGSQQCGCYI